MQLILAYFNYFLWFLLTENYKLILTALIFSAVETKFITRNQLQGDTLILRKRATRISANLRNSVF